MGNAIFLSYRRSDSQAAVGRLADHLGAAFGPERVLVDHELPSAGQSYADLVGRSLEGCSAVLVVIGPAFLRRLGDANDFVRHEISVGLASGIPVLPVLIGGARMPSVAELPEPLVGLAYRNAIELSDERWHQDVARLIEALRRIAGEAARPAGDWAARVRRLFADKPAPGPRTAEAVVPEAAHPPPAEVAGPARAAAPVPAREAEGPRDIFISYAFEDEAWAQRVVTALEEQGYRCWIASRDIVPGTPSYAREITRAIKSVRLLVVVLSASTNGSDDVLSEITLAKNNGVPRLPLRIDASPMDEGLEYFFSQAQRLESATQDVADLLERLRQAVARQLGTPGPKR